MFRSYIINKSVLKALRDVSRSSESGVAAVLMHAAKL
jgi:hypothetical protein